MGSDELRGSKVDMAAGSMFMTNNVSKSSIGSWSQGPLAREKKALSAKCCRPRNSGDNYVVGADISPVFISAYAENGGASLKLGELSGLEGSLSCLGGFPGLSLFLLFLTRSFKRFLI
jgi:hypothetical protein